MEGSLPSEPHSSELAHLTQSLSEENLSLHNADAHLWRYRATSEQIEGDTVRELSILFPEHVTIADCINDSGQATADKTSTTSSRASSTLRQERLTTCASSPHTNTITEPATGPKPTAQDTHNADAFVRPWTISEGIRSFPKPISSIPRSSVTCDDGATLRTESLQSRFAEALRNQGRVYNHRRVIPKEERTRKGLPLIFKVDSGFEEIMTGHDTGTDANHMSLELAQKLGYNINSTEKEKGQFQLPTGKIIESIGRVAAEVQFAQGEDCQTSTFTCYFNVFSHLALPALIGMAFLNATETLTTYTSRLATLPAGWKRSLRLCAVGNTTNEVTCVLNGHEVKATADTGAEIALVGGDYALRHGLLREYSCEELELADGSLEYTSGFGDLTLAIRNPHAGPKGGKWMTKTVRFHVLKHLHFDVILDEDIVEDFDIFQRGIGSVLQLAADMAASLAPIAHLRTIEQSVANTKEKVKGWASSWRSSRPETYTSYAPPRVDAQSVRSMRLAELEEKIQALDRKELQRRVEMRNKRSYTMAEAEQHRQKQTQYHAERQVLVDELQALFPS